MLSKYCQNHRFQSLKVCFLHFTNSADKWHQVCKTAQHVLEEVVSVYPGSAMAWRYLGKIRLELGDFTGAEAAVAHSLKIESINPVVRALFSFEP